MDLTQLWYELKLDLEQYGALPVEPKLLLEVMDDMESRLKGGLNYI